MSPEWVKNLTTCYILDDISPTDIILSSDLWSIFPNKGKKTKQLATSKILFHSQISHLVKPTKAHSMTYVPMTEIQGQRSRSKFPLKWVKKKKI